MKVTPVRIDRGPPSTPRASACSVDVLSVASQYASRLPLTAVVQPLAKLIKSSIVGFTNRFIKCPPGLFVFFSGLEFLLKFYLLADLPFNLAAVEDPRNDCQPGKG